jgi:glycosyltransferase involved in cell wall biosynthesis
MLMAIEPLRVLFVSAEAALGGAERSLLELTARLHAAGIVCGAAVPAEGALAEALRKTGVRVHLVPMRRLRKTVDPRALGGYFIALAHAARKLAEIVKSEGYGLVHGNTDMGHIYGGEAARRAGVPAVWHGRDILDIQVLAPHLADRADRVIAVSAAVRDHLAAFGVPAERIAVVYNGVDLDRFPSGVERAARRRAARAELGLPDGEPIIGTACAFAPIKRVEDFIALYSLFSTRAMAAEGGSVERGRRRAGRAVIFGDDVRRAHPAYAEALRRHAEETAGGRILFAGWREDLPALLPALDVFVSTSRTESFGRAVVEAMASGVPVVVNGAGGMAETVEHERTGLVVPERDLHAMADAVFRLTADPALAGRLADAAEEEVRKRFNVERAARDVMKIYGDLAKGRQSGDNANQV